MRVEIAKLKKIHGREMSEFTANHLLFEFARDTLDKERKTSVEKVMESSAELQNEFIRLINGMQYCEKLSETLVNDAAIKQIEQQSSQVNFIVNRLRWHQWPLGFKWILEACLVGLLLVFVLNVLPLNRIVHLNDSTDNQFVIAEVDRKKKTEAGEQPEANKQNPSFVDEEVKQAPVLVATNTPPKAVELKSKVEPQKAELPTQPPVAVVAQTVEKVIQPKSSGWIYRGQFQVTNAVAISPKIKDRILELGGQKAGEVEIGWQKSPNLYYFHFTVPEAKLAELEALLKDFSTGKMIKEAHPRVMPDGIVRLLFTIEEKATVNK